MNRQDKRAGLQETRDKNKKAHTKYDPTVALDIIERIADGELLKDITSKKARVPTVSRATFMEWVATVPELGQAYKYAMELSAHALEEEALGEARERAESPGNAQKVTASSNLMRQLQWSAERRDPGRYGQKNNAALIVPVTINTSLDLGDNKRAVSEAPDFYKLSIPIEGEYSEVDEGKATAAPSPETETQALTVISQGEDGAINFRSLLRADEPVVGMERQPLLYRKRSPFRKRQLTPRIKVETDGIPSTANETHAGERGRSAEPNSERDGERRATSTPGGQERSDERGHADQLHHEDDGSPIGPDDAGRAGYPIRLHGEDERASGGIGPVTTDAGPYSYGEPATGVSRPDDTATDFSQYVWPAPNSLPAIPNDLPAERVGGATGKPYEGSGSGGDV